MDDADGVEDGWDVVVVGSGFGGSVVAHRAAAAGQRVLVLERGRRYRPGEFPRTPLQVSQSTWDPAADLFGLYQLWSFGRMDAVVASGVGGGSLIYANVALRMPADWFALAQRDRPWPLTYGDIEDRYPVVEEMLGVAPMPPHMDRHVPKAAAFTAAARLAGLEPERAPLAVTFPDPGRPLGHDLPVDHRLVLPLGVARSACRMCGECDLGCNEGAKNTLDLTYLAAACSPRLVARPAEVRPLADVRRVTPVGRGYEVEYVQHEPPEPVDPAQPPVRARADRARRRRRVRARKVVLAAGALGSTWLLLANRVALPGLSQTVGSRFSGNGDALGFVDADPRTAVESSAGPVITHWARAGDHLVQDGGHPAFAAWMATAVHGPVLRRGAAVAAAHVLARLAGRGDTDMGAEVAAVLTASQVARSTLPVLAMGCDTTAGRMRLDGDGRLAVDWPRREAARYFARVWRTVGRMAAASDWGFRRGLSDRLSRSITAHPLGGAPMGRDRWEGVVDDHGEVHGHRGLFVADGAVLPGPIGANPSLTIAALAERFADRITED